MNLPFSKLWPEASRSFAWPRDSLQCHLRLATQGMRKGS